MKLKLIIGLSSALCLSAMSGQAQETNEMTQLKQMLLQMQEKFEQSQNEQRQQIESLRREVAALQSSRATNVNLAVSETTNLVAGMKPSPTSSAIADATSSGSSSPATRFTRP